MSRLDEFVKRAIAEVSVSDKNMITRLPDTEEAYFEDGSEPSGPRLVANDSPLIHTLFHDLSAPCRAVNNFVPILLEDLGEGTPVSERLVTYASEIGRFSTRLKRALGDPNRLRAVAARSLPPFPEIKLPSGANEESHQLYDRLMVGYRVMARYMHQVFGVGENPSHYCIGTDTQILRLMTGLNIVQGIRVGDFRVTPEVVDVFGPIYNAVGNAGKYAGGAQIIISEAKPFDSTFRLGGQNVTIPGYASVLGSDLSGTHRVLVVSDNGPGVDVKALYDSAYKKFGYCPIIRPPFPEFTKMVDRSLANLAVLRGVSTGNRAAQAAHGLNAGLGLSGSFEYMRENGGHLGIRSERGQGTQVYIAVPGHAILQ